MTASRNTTVSAASQPQLTRYPYLTDVVSAGSTFNATINWATDQSQTTAYATYGQGGLESVTAHKVNGSKTIVQVCHTAYLYLHSHTIYEISKCGIYVAGLH